MRILRIFCLLPGLCAISVCDDVQVGAGAPNETIRQRFVAAYYRNGFAYKTSGPPLGSVRQFGPTGLVQEFHDADGNRMALVKATTSTALPIDKDGTIREDVFQVLAPMYSYYSSVGAGTAGYPTMDTVTCPFVDCQYQLFDKNYALFAYQTASFAGQNFATRDPFYTRWMALGGILAMGPASSAEQSVTSSTGTTATLQTYVKGAVYSITSGTLNGRVLGIRQPIYDLYVSYGAHSGFLGFPTSEELQVSGGIQRQSFEGGAIEYGADWIPVLRLAVGSVSVSAGSGPLRMNLGETMTLRATVFASNGAELADRQITWATSNSNVVSIQPSGASVVLKAVGGGTALITAFCEGKASQRITVFVTAPCCQVGEGAPNATVQQAFLDAVTRNRLALRLPTPGTVRRVGHGYVQEFTSADPSAPVRYLITKSDLSPTAYVLTGAILSRFEEPGGLTGTLGYPISDASPGGRQLFENNAALAGTPVRIVSGPILAKWALLGYETGVAGSPAGELSQFLSFAGTRGTAQAFQNGVIYAGQSGPQAGKSFLVSGLILAKYTALGAVSGVFGMPSNDEFGIDGKRRQDFEGGYISYALGDLEAQAYERERRPAVSVTPGVVSPGSRVRIGIGGFAAGSTVRVSISEQPDFVVQLPAGAYSWEAYVPASARSSTVLIRAQDTKGSAAADGSYQIKALAEQRLQLTKVRGDAQSAAPGAQLPQALRVLLKDEAGNPVAGVAVRFTASPGAQATPSSAVTDAGGEAEATLRLPPAEGVALCTAEVQRQIVTFSARATPSTLANFPRFTQAGDAPLGKGSGTLAQKGALLAASASILRHYQNLSELPAPNGLADPPLLNQFLTSLCVFDSQGAQICDGFVSPPGSAEQIVNLWRLGSFVGGGLDVSVEQTDMAALRDLLAQGRPLLLALALSSNDAPAGAHFVVAIGVSADAGILIHDPNPAFGRTSLNEYLGGFSVGSQAWKGTLTGAVRLLPQAPSPTGFLAVAGNTPFQVSCAAGLCGRTVEWPDAPASSQPPARLPGLFRARYCDGAQSVYQLEVSAEGFYELTVTDLGNLGNRFQISGQGAAAYKLLRPAAQLAISPQDVSFSARSVVNAASFSNAIAPGTLISIFGSGLGRTGGTTAVEINGISSPVIAVSPFQVNAQVPLELGVGSYMLKIRSPYGSAEQSIDIQEAAPAIFQVDSSHGAIVNQDGTLNAPTNPARRGQVITIYGTGLGAVTRKGTLQVAATPVTAILDGAELAAAFAGLTPGFLGLYQVNLPIPASTPPRLDAPLALKQGAVLSKAVEVAVQ